MVDDQLLTLRQRSKCGDDGNCRPTHNDAIIATTTASLSSWNKSCSGNQGRPIILPIISPENDWRQRPRDDWQKKTSSSSCCSFQTKKSPTRSIHYWQNQPQINTITTSTLVPTIISPESNNTAKGDEEAYAAICRNRSIIVSTPAAQQHHLNAYQTPPKITTTTILSSDSLSLSPKTGVTPFLENNRKRNACLTPRSFTTPPSYSPITPNTSVYMKHTSPFRSCTQLLDEELHSVMNMDLELSNKIHGLEELYHEQIAMHACDNDDNEDYSDENNSNHLIQTPTCTSRQMKSDTCYYSTRSRRSSIATPRWTLMTKFHTPHTLSNATSDRVPSKEIHDGNDHPFFQSCCSKDNHPRRRCHSQSCCSLRRSKNDLVIQTNSQSLHHHHRSASDDCGTRRFLATEFKREKEIEMLHDRENEYLLPQQKEQQNFVMLEDSIRLRQLKSPVFTDETINRSPKNFSKVLWHAGKETTPSSSCDDKSFHCLTTKDRSTELSQDEQISRNRENEADEQFIRQPQHIVVEDDSVYYEESFYIGEEEGLVMFASIEESDISETDVSGEYSYITEEEGELDIKSMSLSGVEDQDSFECQYLLKDQRTELSQQDEQTYDSKNSGYDADKHHLKKPQHVLVQDDSAYYEDSFYIGSNISKTDVSDKNSDVTGEEVDIEIKSLSAVVDRDLFECRNLQCLERRCRVQSLLKENEHLRIELEQRNLVEDHRNKIECVRTEMASPISSALEVENTIATLREELATVQVLNGELALKYENMRVEHTVQLSMLQENKIEAEAHIQSLQMKIDELVQYYLDETHNMKISFDEQQSALISEYTSIIGSMKDDFERKLDEKRTEITRMELSHRECAADYVSQISEISSQLANARALNDRHEEEHREIIDDMNVKLSIVACEKDCLAKDLTVANESIEVQLRKNENDQEAIRKQLTCVRTERDDLMREVANLKEALGQSVRDQAAIESSLLDAQNRIAHQMNQIASMETTHQSQTTQIKKLEQDISSLNRQLDEVAKKVCDVSAEHASQEPQSACTELSYFSDQNAQLKKLVECSAREKDAIQASLTEATRDFARHKNIIQVKLDEKDQELKRVTHQLHNSFVEYKAQVSQMENQLQSEVKERVLLEEQHTIITRKLDDANTKLVTTVCEIESLARDLTAAKAKNEALSVELKHVKNEKKVAEQLIRTTRTEQDTIELELANMKVSLDETLVEKATVIASLDHSNHELARLKSNITEMETERVSHSNQILELEQQVSSQNELIKSIQEDFERRKNEFDLNLSEAIRANAAEQSALFEGIEGQLVRAIEAKELLEARNQILAKELNDINSQLSRSTCENSKLVTKQVASQAENKVLSLQIKCAENERRYSDKVTQVASWESHPEKEVDSISLDSAIDEVNCRDDRIGVLESERVSLLNRNEELEHLLAFQNSAVEKLRNETAEYSHELLSLKESNTHMPNSLSSKEARLLEQAASNSELMNIHLQFVKDHEKAIEEKDVILVEQPSKFPSLKVHLSEDESETCSINQTTHNIASSEKETNELRCISESDSKTTFSRDGRFNRIQELDHVLASMNSDSQDILAKVDHFQELAAKLVVSALKLKLQLQGCDSDDQAVKEKISFNDQFLALSETGTELRWLYAKVIDKTGVLFELRQESDPLTEGNRAVDRTLIDKLHSEIQLLKETNLNLMAEREVAEKLQIILNKDAPSKQSDISLEELRIENSRLRQEVDGLHDDIAVLQSEKESLSRCMRDYKSKICQLLDKVTSMEEQEVSDANQIRELESYLVSKLNRLEMSINKPSDKSSADISLGIQKAAVEVAISSLQSHIFDFINRFHEMSTHLDVTYPNNIAGQSIEILETAQVDEGTASNKNYLEASSKSSKRRISEEEMTRIRTFMTKAQQIVTSSERERKQLEREVKGLRSDLKRKEQELMSARQDSSIISRMRNSISQSKVLLEKAKEEKNQVKFELMNTRNEMEFIRKAASQSSHNAIVEQSENELMSASIVSPPGIITRQSVMSQISSVEKFKIDKGQSMLELLKSTKKSGRKENVKYRRGED